MIVKYKEFLIKKNYNHILQDCFCASRFLTRKLVIITKCKVKQMQRVLVLPKKKTNVL